MSYKFCNKFHTISNSAKNLKIGVKSDKVTESLKVGTFFETQCRTNMHQQLSSLSCTNYTAQMTS